MFSGVYTQGQSESMSCSTVNGKTICTRQRGPGNSAMSSSQSFSGPGGSSQNVDSGIGYPGDVQYNSQSYQTGADYSGFSSDYAPNFGFFMGSQPPVNGFAGGIAVGGFNFPSPGSAPNSGFIADSVPAVGGFGFATAGSFPWFSSGSSYSASQSGMGYPSSSSSLQSGKGSTPQDSQVYTGNGGGFNGFFPGPFVPIPGFPGFPGFAGAGAVAYAGRR